MSRHFSDVTMDIDMYLEIRYKQPLIDALDPMACPAQQYIVHESSRTSRLKDLFKSAHRKRYGFILIQHYYIDNQGTYVWAHANILILAYETHKIHLFDPHGCPRTNMSKGIRQFFNNIMVDRRLAYHTNNWRFDDLRPPVRDDEMYYNGLQMKGKNKDEPFGTCILWCFLVAHRLITSPSSRIVRVLNALYKSENIRDEMATFLQDAWNSYFEGGTLACNQRYHITENLTFSNVECDMSRDRHAPLINLQ
jgi:hypothetical protein